MSERATLPSEDVYRRARGLRLRVLRRVRTLLAGTYRSAFRGPGVEFLEFAPYEPGDDVRRIDWLVSARRPRPYVRRHAEERELKLLLVIDTSASMDVGPPGRTPRALACTLAAAMGLAAAWNGDRTGAMLFGGDRADLVPFRPGERHVMGILSRMLTTVPDGPRTDLRPALRRLRALRGHVTVLLLSDFLCVPSSGDDKVRALLAACARKHDMLAVRLEAARPPDALGRAFLAGVEAESGRPVLRKAPAAPHNIDASRPCEDLAGCRVRCSSMRATDDWLRVLVRLLGGTETAGREAFQEKLLSGKAPRIGVDFA